jgi:hypothetical protein
MPLTIAFKIATNWFGHESILEYSLDKAISDFTHSPYCHTEAWISGPISYARCFSSRNPSGTSIKGIDLSDDNLWKKVSIPTTGLDDQLIEGFCKGSSGRKYDEFGILGIGLDTTIHDPYDRICSESCFEIVSLVKTYPAEIKRWMISPGGVTIPGKRYGLFELLTV